MCGKKLSILFLLFFLVSVLSYSLSQEEREKLPSLGTQTLVAIILEYDRGLTAVESVLARLQISTTREKKILQMEKEEWIVQEKIYLDSLKMANLKTKRAYLFGGAAILNAVALIIYMALTGVN